MLAARAWIAAGLGMLLAGCTVSNGTVGTPISSSSPTNDERRPLPTEPPAAAQPDGPVIRGAQIVGSPIPYPAFGDLWMPTWAADDRLYLSWGDGTGFGDGYPVGFPDYLSTEPAAPPACPKDVYAPEDEGYFPCWLWRNVFASAGEGMHPRAPLTDAGVLVLEGQVPEFDSVEIAAIDIPSGEPFFLAGPAGTFDIAGTNDKPSSLLALGGRLYLAGHTPAGFPAVGYLAVSDDGGRTWAQIPGSPWGEASPFRVLMFINMGQAYSLNRDGYVYALGVGTEASWTDRTVFLARVPADAVSDYGAWEYFTGRDGDDPRWADDQSLATRLDGVHATGQSSAMFHPGTDRYLFLTTDAGSPQGPPRAGALYEAPAPWGPWTGVAAPCFVPECDDGSQDPGWADGKYIAGLIPKGAGPNDVYFTIAGGDEHYQLQIGRLLLELD